MEMGFNYSLLQATQTILLKSRCMAARSVVQHFGNSGTWKNGTVSSSPSTQYQMVPNGSVRSQIVDLYRMGSSLVLYKLYTILHNYSSSTTLHFFIHYQIVIQIVLYLVYNTIMHTDRSPNYQVNTPRPKSFSDSVLQARPSCRAFGLLCGVTTCISSGALLVSGGGLVVASRASITDNIELAEQVLHTGISLIATGVGGLIGGSFSIICTYMNWKRDGHTVAPHNSFLNIPNSQHPPSELFLNPPAPILENKTMIPEAFAEDNSVIRFYYKKESDDQATISA